MNSSTTNLNQDNVETVESKFASDKKYIKSTIMAKQPNGNYTKFSKILNGVSIVNESEHDYIKYWSNRYKDNNTYKNAIINVCKDKLLNGLIPTEEMIAKVKASKDTDKEKTKVLNYLLGVEQ